MAANIQGFASPVSMPPAFAAKKPMSRPAFGGDSVRFGASEETEEPKKKRGGGAVKKIIGCCCALILAPVLLLLAIPIGIIKVLRSRKNG